MGDILSIYGHMDIWIYGYMLYKVDMFVLGLLTEAESFRVPVGLKCSIIPGRML